MQSNICQTESPFGTLNYFSNDNPIGAALREYGEWAGIEINFLRSFLNDGAVAVDVGANIGTHTVAFAQKVGPLGQIYALEPQPRLIALLERNVASNALENVRVIQAGAGRKSGRWYAEPVDVEKHANLGATILQSERRDGSFAVDVLTIDELNLGTCQLVKIDVEGMEGDVIAGMKRTIASYRPVLFAECNSIESGARIMASLQGDGYALYLVATAAFNALNFRGSSVNMFGVARETALLCLPAEKHYELPQFTPEIRINQVKNLDALAETLLATPRYGDESEHDRDPLFLRQQIAELRRDYVVAKASVQELRPRVAELEKQCAAADALVQELKAEVVRLEFRTKSLTQQLDSALCATEASDVQREIYNTHQDAIDENNALKIELRLVKGSISWRLTAPLRKMKRAAERLLKRGEK